jgi:rhamnosyltransferase
MSLTLIGVVVVYNPDETIMDNIYSYFNNIDKLFIVDNSETINISFVNQIINNQKIFYIDNHGNQGIAHALNNGAKKAIEMGYEWLLTMDQDSSFDSNMLDNYLNCWNNYPDKDNVAIFSPVHNILEYQTSSITKCNAVNKFHVLASGNIINLKAFKYLEGFNEALFIDEVDHEYCLRSKLAGFSIIEFPNILLKHNLGETVSIQRHGQIIESTTYHSPKRFYYITRNRLYMWKTYQHLFPNLVEIQFISIMKTLIFPLIYHNKKTQRFFYIIRGILHFLIGRYGK